jgi:hypothetical protein
MSTRPRSVFFRPRLCRNAWRDSSSPAGGSPSPSNALNGCLPLFCVFATHISSLEPRLWRSSRFFARCIHNRLRSVRSIITISIAFELDPPCMSRDRAEAASRRSKAGCICHLIYQRRRRLAVVTTQRLQTPRALSNEIGQTYGCEAAKHSANRSSARVAAQAAEDEAYNASEAGGCIAKLEAGFREAELKPSASPRRCSGHPSLT